ncbi:MAG TPA: elongation factor G [Terriglobales bacterium]|nr:elongation factor G [Terriglobales bacterium]
MAEDVKQVRSIGIVGQGGVGKTSLADGLIFAAGAVTRQGRPDEENSAFDTEPEEMRRRSTLTTSIFSFTYKKHDLTLLDMPGYASFLGDAIHCLRGCTSLIFTVAPAAGQIRVEAETMWQRAAELRLPAIAFVTRMDREHADFDAAIGDLRSHLGAKPVPVQMPIGAAESFRGVVDLLTMKALLAQPDGKLKEEAIPADVQAQAAAAREAMIELAAEATDELTEKYLEHGTLTNEEVLQALRQGTLSGTLTPVLCGSSAKTIGMQPLLDATIAYLGSAADLGTVEGRDPKIAEPLTREPAVSEPFSAYVFKTMVDPFAGKLTLFRVMSGTATDATVLNVSKDTRERLGHLLRLEGKKQTQIARALPGEIVAVAKLKDTATGDTLADEKSPIVFPRVELPPPAISFAVAPKGKGDEEKAAAALHRLMEEDPSLDMHRDPQTRELILSGVGQLHIEVIIERMHRKYGAEVELKAPKIPYKETIKGRAESQGKLKKQSGGRGQYGDCWLKVEPLARGAQFEFVDEIVGGVVPRQYIPAVEKGVREAMNEGILAGYPIVDVKVTLYDGSYHDVDSSEMAFKIAASMGFKAALEKAKPILLEPIMNMEVAVPDDCMGDVIGDLNSRRGKVQSVDARGHGQVIKASVPMSEVLKYAPDLTSMTSGRGSFTMGFSHYEELPGHLVDKVVKEAHAEREHHHGHHKE